MSELSPGLYELLHTQKLQKRLHNAGLLDRAVWKDISFEDLYHYLAIPIAREISTFISEVLVGNKNAEVISIFNEALCSAEKIIPVLETLRLISLQTLQQIKPPSSFDLPVLRPDTPLSTSALLTGSARTPALRSQLIKELASCDRADWLVSFVKYAGIVPLLPTLREFTETRAPDGGPRLRIATTSYMGATDKKAIEALLDLDNTEVRVSYDTKRTRLHAKAYIFHRESSFGSAYIGSANISKAALDEGLEWTAKISEYETSHLWKHIIATFESHWEDETEFSPCTKKDLPTLAIALSKERGADISDHSAFYFDLRPYGYQQAILEDIDAERGVGKNKHLVIAATGTGKTMIAAFDYKRFCRGRSKYPRLLFVAHREEILRQAQTAFRNVLRDGSFGDIVAGSMHITQTDHLFCTVQSWNSRTFQNFDQSHFEYVVLDEAHHATANSYQSLIDHIRPNTLLGLTATPERTDGGDIRDDFGGSFTHEIRLPEAIERALLCPFHYYGIPDLQGLDFSAIAWKRGGYDIHQLRQQLESNFSRAHWVVGQLERYITDVTRVRGLGFCVSVAHAEFMADFCNRMNIPAIALSGESDDSLRHTAQQRLQRYDINFIFTADLYNEGVDIPFVDTLLFLRPTESLSLFIQQFGRGLRLNDDKSHLTVLDFIAPQHRHFNFAKRFQSLSSRPGIRVETQIESDMPYVPSGCLVHLEKQAKTYILNNIRNATARLRGNRLLDELRQMRQNIQGQITLQRILDYLNLDNPSDLYKHGLPHDLLARATNSTVSNDGIEIDETITNGFRRLALMDDPYLIQDARRLISSGKCNFPFTQHVLHCTLWGNKRPEDKTLEQVHTYVVSSSGVVQDLIELFDWLLANRTPIPRQQFENYTGPLNLHAAYTRDQVLLALGVSSFEKVWKSYEGVLHVPKRSLDVFFADVNKTESDFSPTTMYDDYAITDRLFHWQSQSTTSAESTVGRRYINHEQLGYKPFLFIREQKKLPNGMTSPYCFVGPLKYLKHEGSKPMSITWELECPLPAKVLAWARRIS